MTSLVRKNEHALLVVDERVKSVVEISRRFVCIKNSLICAKKLNLVVYLVLL